MLSTVQILQMSSADKIGEAIKRSMPLVPSDAREVLLTLIQPQTLGIIAVTLVAWAGSHFFGVGELVDIILLTVGVFALGFSVFEGAKELFEFSHGAIDAKTDSDLENAAKHFAKAVVILGISTIQAILLRGQAGAVVARGKPTIYPRVRVGAPPPSGNKLRLSRPDRIADGSLGGTNAYGVITVARNQSLSEQRITLFHELVHRYFSPKTGPFRKIRAEINMSAYTRSALLRYLEEALAEGFGQLRVHGLVRAFAAYRFPLTEGYVTISTMAAEGAAIGTIALGGVLLRVSISSGPIRQP
jgi:hypothetical protein